jgi:ABC-type transport system involved in multi-copper enzyme maturation permease subunit
MSTVYFLSLRQLRGRWRIIALIGLLVLPMVPAIVAVLASDKPSAEDLDNALLTAALASAILPIVVLTLATPLFGNELEDKTLSNLTLTPLPRWQLMAAKLAAAVTIALPLVAASSFVSVLVAFNGAELDGATQAALAAAVGFSIGVLVYAALFVWLGLVSQRALGIGLFYVFVWEGLFGTFVDGLKYLSIRSYSLSIVDAVDSSRFDETSQSVIGIEAAVIGAIVVFGVFTLLTIRRLRTMDVP